mmetsp:Transcript_24406/g.61209  ORF Transcript_24406/g.61209 Transcript_24406/m.61209 type:complete len:517 (+) Transcript_24406:103-1653(+)
MSSPSTPVVPIMVVTQGQERLSPAVQDEFNRFAGNLFSPLPLPLNSFVSRLQFAKQVLLRAGIARNVSGLLGTATAERLAAAQNSQPGPPPSLTSRSTLLMGPANMVPAIVYLTINSAPTMTAHIGATVDRNGSGGGGLSFAVGNLMGRGDQLTASAGVGATSLQGDHSTSLSYHVPLYGRTLFCVGQTSPAPTPASSKEGDQALTSDEPYSVPLFHPAYQTPFPLPLPHLRVSAFRQTRDRSTASSHHITSTGFSAEHQRVFPDSPQFRHTFSYQLEDRHVTMSPRDETTRPSRSIRCQAGHNLKSSVSYAFCYETRDHPIFPTQGFALQSDHEFAGLLGCTRFYKENLSFQAHKSLRFGAVLSLRTRFGFLVPLDGDESHLSDRFFLGTTNDALVKGFKDSSVGPVDNDCHIGGTAHWGANASITFPLPKPIPSGLWGNINAGVGNIAMIDFGSPSLSTLQSFITNPRASAGVGLALNLGEVRLDVGLNYVLAQQATDVTSLQGISIGLTTNLF